MAGFVKGSVAHTEHQKMRERMIEAVKALKEEGLSVREISEKLLISESAVRTAAKHIKD